MLHRLLPSLRPLLLMTLAAPVAGLLGGCVNDQQVIAQANDVNGTLKPAFLTQPALAGYIQSVGDRVVAAARQAAKDGYNGMDLQESQWMFKDIKFHLVNSKTLNAFTTGGEHVYLYSQLFQDVDSEDAFAAVVAHEFGHIYGRHVASGMKRQMTLMAVAAGAGVGASALAPDGQGDQYGSLASGVAGGVGQFVGMGFTRGDEAAADKMGFHFYVLAGWDPTKFADFFKTMIAKGYDTTPEYMSDHPKLSNRVEAVQGYVNELPPDAASYRRPDIATPTQFRKYQQQAAQLASSEPTSESLQKAQTLLAAFPSCVAPAETADQRRAQQALSETADQMGKSK